MSFNFILFYLLCGLIDYLRNKSLKFNSANLKTYYLRKGAPTFYLSPLNLLSDILSIQTYNKPVLKISDLNLETRKELSKLFNIFDNNRELIINHLNCSNTNDSRSMIMLKWYGRETSNDLKLEGLNVNEFKYVKTIGISFFLPNVKTSRHYGPIRLTYRCLYNINKVQDNSYIECDGNVNKWRENPIFIFDDTFIHQSFSDSEERYCAFIDIVRPTYFYTCFNVIITIFGLTFGSFKQLFYKNWNFK